ncbi:MAG: cupin domain-containing protein [Alphaproteobacteria bacterium]|nr:cupin domain-containing protein [Alphaproteobacteria bacterium]
MFKPRRIVTGHDARGRSVILSDEAPPAPDSAGQVVFWTTDAAPAQPRDPAQADRLVGRLPPPRGCTRFLVFDMPPDDPAVPVEQVRKFFGDMFAKLGVPDAQIDTSRNPRMHRTHTIDYIMVLSGEVTLLLDEGEVRLRPFDVVIQQGTNHAWVNRGREPVTLLGVLIDAAGV